MNNKYFDYKILINLTNDLRGKVEFILDSEENEEIESISHWVRVKIIRDYNRLKKNKVVKNEGNK